MNRFLINYSPELCARDLCDKHVVKMPLEEAQMLCTTVRLHAPEYAEEAGLYRADIHWICFVKCAVNTHTDMVRYMPHGVCMMHL
jgi:hypothetical protein